MEFKFNKKILYIMIAAAVLVFLLSSRRFRKLISRKTEIVRLRKELKEFKFENAKLKREIYLLENDKLYAEYLIRRDLGYLKPEEFEYRFKEK